MAPPQGLIRFPGVQQVQQVQQGTYSLSHGISPGAAAITMVPQQGFVAESGDLEFTFGSTRITFPDCRINAYALRRTSSGMVVTLQILDRRWKWAHGEISGLYNVRKADDELDVTTERTPQQLAELLLEAMYESGFDVSALPNQPRPAVDWVSANPAQELARLCDSLGCRVVLGIDNRVRLCKLGLGRRLPQQDQLNEGYGIDPPERPDSIKVVGAADRFQAKLWLQPVGLDTDGSIKPIDDLSYKPLDGGWENQHPDTIQADFAENGARELAVKTVYRWYQVVLGVISKDNHDLPVPEEDDAQQDDQDNQADQQPDKKPRKKSDKLGIPGYDGTIAHLWQVLPVEDVQILTQLQADGTPTPIPATVEGMFYDRVNNPPLEANTPVGTKFNGSFKINTNDGIVEFEQPVFKLDEANDALFAPASLMLECAFSIKDLKLRQPERYEKERTLPGKKYGTGPQIVRKDEVVRTHVAEMTMESSTRSKIAKVVTNQQAVDREAEYYLDATAAGYQAPQSADIEYAGLKRINPDGAIQQVSWSVGANGCTTRASRNTEFNLVVPGYDERRRLEEAAKSEREQHRARLAENRKKQRGRRS